MLVEDEPDIQLITRIALERVGGFEVLVCGSGAEALRSAPNYAPDLILLDNMMPGMNGISTMAALRAVPELAATPVVFITASNENEMRLGLIRRGALGVIFKPFEPRALIEQIVSIWQSGNPAPDDRELPASSG